MAYSSAEKIVTNLGSDAELILSPQTAAEPTPEEDLEPSVKILVKFINLEEVKRENFC